MLEVLKMTSKTKPGNRKLKRKGSFTAKKENKDTSTKEEVVVSESDVSNYFWE